MTYKQLKIWMNEWPLSIPMINIHACRESAKGWSLLVTSMFFPFLNGSLKMARGLHANKKKVKVN
jgi:hypothetical protein